METDATTWSPWVVETWAKLVEAGSSLDARCQLTVVLNDVEIDLLPVPTVAVVLDTTVGEVTVRSGTRVVSRRQLRAIYSVILSANRDSAVYDARGLGYGVSNITIRIRRGTFVDTLTMSRLGRLTW